MSRCVVCGARPSEACNQRTHDAHYRMWQKNRRLGGRGRGNADARADLMVAALDRVRRAKK